MSSHKQINPTTMESPRASAEELNLVKHIQGLLSSETADSNKQIFTIRQVGRLVKSWPSFDGSLCCFENEHCIFANLPIDLLVELLSFIPLLTMYKLSTVARMFAFPQPSLRNAQSIIATAAERLGRPSRWAGCVNPCNIWLKAAPPNPVTRCLVVRERRQFHMMKPSEYTLYVQDSARGNEVLLLIAVRQGKSFHIYNVMRGYLSRQRLRKYGGNFLGELRTSGFGLDHVMLSADGSLEYGAMSYRQPGQINNVLFDGPQPRRCQMLFPTLNADNIPTAVVSARNRGRGLLDQLRRHILEGTNNISPNLFLVKTKEPHYDPVSNSYRLNFHGRVTVPSIKNLQVIHAEDPSKVLCQFGKTDTSRFHLDFKRPFNAFQAFCIALASFTRN